MLKSLVKSTAVYISHLILQPADLYACRVSPNKGGQGPKKYRHSFLELIIRKKTKVTSSSYVFWSDGRGVLGCNIAPSFEHTQQYMLLNILFFAA